MNLCASVYNEFQNVHVPFEASVEPQKDSMELPTYNIVSSNDNIIQLSPFYEIYCQCFTLNSLTIH